MADSEIIKTYIVEMKALVDRKSHKDALKATEKIKKSLDKLNDSYGKGEIKTRAYRKSKRELTDALIKEGKAIRGVDKAQEKYVKTLGNVAAAEAKINNIVGVGKARDKMRRSAGRAAASYITTKGAATSSVYQQGTANQVARKFEVGNANVATLREGYALKEAHQREMSSIRQSGRTGSSSWGRGSGGGGFLRGGLVGGAVGGLAGTARVFSPGLPAMAAGAMGAFGTMKMAQSAQQAFGDKMAFSMVEGGETRGLAAQQAFIRRSNVSGINASDNTTNYLNMKTALKAQGLEGQSEDIFFGFADYGKAMGVDPERMNRAMVAVGQIAGKNQVTSEELNFRLSL